MNRHRLTGQIIGYGLLSFRVKRGISVLNLKLLRLCLAMTSVSICAFYLCLRSVLYAEPGTTALNFLKILPGIKGAGMGEAFTAVCDDANGIYWNPAGLTQIEYQVINAGYTKWFQEISYQTVSFVQPSKIGNFSLCLNNLSFNDVDGYNNAGVPTDELDVYDRALLISYANKIHKNISAGLNLKIIQEKLDDESVQTYALDFGSLYKFNIPLSLGISLQNIGPKVKYISEKDPLPFNIKLGCGYKLFNDDLTFAVDYNIPKDVANYFNIGMEYQFLDLLKLRAGYKFRDINGTRLGFGIGNEKLSFDYAFVPFGILGDTHRFGLTFYFGRTYRLDVADVKIEKHLKKGKRYFSKNDFIAAQKEFKNVLVYDPVNAQAQSYLDKIKLCITKINAEKYLISGEKYLEADELLKAKDEFENILLLMPENEQAKKYLVEVENKISQQQKQRLEVLFTQGKEFYERGEYEDAINIWEKVLLLDKEHPASKEYILLAKNDIEKREKIKVEARLKAMYETAEELFKKEKYKKALDLFTEIDNQLKSYLQTDMYLNRTKEKVAEMYFKEGLKLYENGFYKEAVGVFEKSLKYFPEYKEAKERITIANEKIAEEKEKLKILSDEYNKKGLIEYNQGNIKGAIKFFEKALESNPEHETAGKNLDRAKKELK